MIARVRQAALSLPGVHAAAPLAAVPLLGGGPPEPVVSAGKPDETRYVQVARAGEGTRAVLGAAMVAGRDLLIPDGASGAEPVALINEAQAQSLSPGNPAGALGTRLRVGPGPWRRVAGISRDVRQVLIRPAWPEIVIPFDQAASRDVSFVLWASADPGTVARLLRLSVNAMDPALAVSDVQSMETVIADSFPRVMAAGLGIFAGAALALAALGATRGEVTRLVFGQSARLAFAGLVLGYAGAVGLARILSYFIYGVGPADPMVLGSVAALLTAVALTAALGPALRVSRIDPLAALREE
jgi:putative ABC transport system permease protein